MISWIMAVALMLPTAVLPSAVAVPDAQPPARERIMAVPPELQARLRDEIVADHPSQHERLQRLVEFMFAPPGLGMAYRGDATYTVEQSYASREANCLSFTLLFLALAREAGLDAYPQVIEETLGWDQRDSTIYRNIHINAGVRIGGQRYTVDVASDSVIARHHPEQVSDQRLLALYYNNQAVELLEQNRVAPALAYMAEAIDLDPDYAAHWSNAGVLYLRDGDPAKAERAYTRALTLAPQYAGALFNMVGLYERLGDHKRETEFRQRLERVQERDPFHHFLLAIGLEKSGDYRRAVKHYQRAIRLYPDEHRFYFALAKAYVQLGDVRRASRALLRAQANSDGTTRDLYQAKLESLRKPRAPPGIAQ
jgi:tetratricopeptide (TPR) repeat protein